MSHVNRLSNEQVLQVSYPVHPRFLVKCDMKLRYIGPVLTQERSPPRMVVKSVSTVYPIGVRIYFPTFLLFPLPPLLLLVVETRKKRCVTI